MTEHQSTWPIARSLPINSGEFVETEGSEEAESSRMDFGELNRQLGSPRKAKDPCNYSEEELIAAAQDGTSFALEELLKRHRTTVYRMARRFAESTDDADDLVQETMLRAFVNIGKFRSEARFSSWLVAIVVNAALSNKRKSSHFRWIYLDEIRESEEGLRAFALADVRPNPEQEYLHRELRIVLRREVLRQHRKYRSILQACDLGELSVEEAARVLGITRAAAKSRLHRARRNISGALQKYKATRAPSNTGQLGV